MTGVAGGDIDVPRIESLKVRNFRVLKDVKMERMTPLTVLLGPNGSGKSTLFDVFAFLSDCFENGLRHAWDRRGRGSEIKTRDSEGPVVVELKYRERPDMPLVAYRLEVDEDDGSPVVAREWLRWKRGSYGRPFHFLETRYGMGHAIGGERPDSGDERQPIALKSPDLLAVNALGQFQEHPRAAALRDFVMSWHVSCLSADGARERSGAKPRERLTETGDNLANVVRYLGERHPERLGRISEALSRRVPHVEGAHTRSMPGGQLILHIKDAPFNDSVLARFASDGTLKMLAYLVLLYDPDPPPFIGIEEPENFLHPRLLPELAEECCIASDRTQMFVTTHSPFFLDDLRPEEVRIMWRDETGCTRMNRAADIERVRAFVREGARLGQLWMENQFDVGDPLTRHGAPAPEIDGAGR